MKNLNKLRDEAFETAKAHGWHEAQPMSVEHWLCLVVSELMEAVNADRKGRRANLQGYLDDVAEYPTYSDKFFEKYIKDTVEDELADAVIRMLDFAGLRGYDVMYEDYDTGTFDNRTFTECIYYIAQVIVFPLHDNSSSTPYISIRAVETFADKLLGIDLMTFVELKMGYNKNRPHRHGNLKY